MKPPFIEFDQDQDSPPTLPERRDFLKLMGASVALAGASGCTRAPRGKIVPYADQPPEVTPGVASHYATALTREGYAVGIVVESHEGRPTKIEGNPDHPMSLGGTGVFEQASVLDVYDRDRGNSVTRRGAISSLDAAIANLAINTWARGRGVHLLLEPTSSLLTADLLEKITRRLPEARVHFHSPLSARNAWAGARSAFGAPYETLLNLENADVILAIDSDFLTSGPAALRHARRFAERRRVSTSTDSMNRLYVVEPCPTVTGNAADHRLRARRSEIPFFLAAIVAELAAHASDHLPLDALQVLGAFRSRAPNHAAHIATVARDLITYRGRSLIVVGEAQPPVVHVLGHVANTLLGNFGSTVSISVSPILDAGGSSHDLSELKRALAANEVETLIVLGGNPAYASAADLDLAARMSSVKRSIYLGAHENETAAALEFYVPLAHALETWGDARAIDGTTSIVQPLLGAPESAKNVDEILAYFIADSRSPSGMHAHDLTREFWQRTHPESFDAFWTTTLTRGVIANSAFAPQSPDLRWHDVIEACAALAAASTSNDSVELVINEDPRVHDGAFTNNPWLLELPDPVHKLTWENAALVSKAFAAQAKLVTGDVVDLQIASRKVQAPILVVPGIADNTVALTLGYGRRGNAQIADGAGASAYILQSRSAPWLARNVSLTKTAKTRSLALAQSHFSLEGRDEDIALRASLREFQTNPDFAKPSNALKKSLYVVPQEGPRQWGMVVDLSACIGCNACVVACQSENNIPVVGKAGVLKSREMHWMRIDSYRSAEDDDPKVVSQPMLCQHCEKAPCEYVCPTNATVHSTDGLNQMVYNRCVGTRFCSNNCPWKVRRFNWFDYQADADAASPRVHNPDVTVRGRGVMEKCTYCVQRIREAEIRSEVSGKQLDDNAFKTACEQACPSAAIVFGNIADAKSRVSTERKNPRLFAVLNDLGTVPRTRYLAKIDNPNDDMP